MSTITRPNSYTAGTTIDPTQVNSDLNTIYNDYNGNITNANVASGAAIAASKLALATISQTVAMSGSALNFAEGGSLSSASTVNIGAATGNSLHITGTVTITAFDTIQAGTQRDLIFDGALILTHNGTSLILPTGANITTAAGDTATMMSEGSGNWRCLAYNPKSGSPLVAATAATALSKSVVQVVNTQTGAVATGSTAIPFDDTIPQITEGDQYMSLAITPFNASNTLRIEIIANLTNASDVNGMAFCLFQDATANALAVTFMDGGAAAEPNIYTLSYYMTAGTTSSTTFRMRAGGDSGTTTFNGVGGARKYGGVLASSMTITEYKA